MLTYSVMASFQARAATKPREVVMRVKVCVATLWWIGFLAGLAFIRLLYSNKKIKNSKILKIKIKYLFLWQCYNT